MGLKDYLFGRRFVLRAPHSTQDVARRIREATVSWFNPLSSGVGGWCRFGRLHLSYSQLAFDNGFQAVLSGRMRYEFGSTIIGCRYGASLYIRAFLSFWYGFLALAAGNLLVSIVGGNLQTGYEPFGLLVVCIFLVIPLLFYFFIAKSADRELVNILEFLEQNADLTIHSDQRLP